MSLSSYMEVENMVNIVTIPNDNEPVINNERYRIVRATPAGWIYVAYNKESDHTSQISRAGAGNPLDILDFDCHGSPTRFNDTDLSSLPVLAQALRSVPGFSSDTQIYLDACNTGLTSEFGGPIAQALAEEAGCTVFGTRGYMRGTFAERSEECFASANGLPPYPGASDATGRKVWIRFGPDAAPRDEKGGRYMAFIITVNADGPPDFAAEAIVLVVEETLQTPRI